MASQPISQKGTADGGVVTRRREVVEEAEVISSGGLLRRLCRRSHEAWNTDVALGSSLLLYFRDFLDLMYTVGMY
jgi:hypothetical protein